MYVSQVIFVAILAWYPVSGEDKVLMLPQRMARSSICTSKCGPVAVRWVRKNDAPVVPWGWIATELITAQIGLMITDQSSGVTFLE